MTPLTRSILPSILPSTGVTVGRTPAGPERVMQFGEGNFLRAFVDWMFQELIDRGLYDGRIVVVQPLENGMVAALNRQEGLYTVVQRGYEGGTLTERRNLIAAVSRGIDPYTRYEDFLAAARNPDLRVIVSNTTESGIRYTACERPAERCPASFPAKVTALLFERFTAFAGDPSKGMLIIPCELIERNGDELKRCVLRHAEDWNCGGAFTAWVEGHCRFYNTLVDRIVPGFPKEEMAELTAQFGYRDDLLVACEVFHKWVIQGHPDAQRELRFTEAGLNVVWTDDITPHRTLKVRILNGAHTTFTIPAYLAGKEFVKESMEDELIGRFIRDAVGAEILPTLAFHEQEKIAFAEAVLERFRNPHIKHALLSITLNTLSKYAVRVLPSLLEYHRLNGTVPARLSFSLAALIRFYRPAGTDANGSVGEYDGRRYPIQDVPEVLSAFRTLWETHGSDHAALAEAVLSRNDWWGTDLRNVSGLSAAVRQYLDRIASGGIRNIIAHF